MSIFVETAEQKQERIDAYNFVFIQREYDRRQRRGAAIPEELLQQKKEAEAKINARNAYYVLKNFNPGERFDFLRGQYANKNWYNLFLSQSNLPKVLGYVTPHDRAKLLTENHWQKLLTEENIVQVLGSLGPTDCWQMLNSEYMRNNCHKLFTSQNIPQILKLLKEADQGRLWEVISAGRGDAKVVDNIMSDDYRRFFADAIFLKVVSSCVTRDNAALIPSEYREVLNIPAVAGDAKEEKRAPNLLSVNAEAEKKEERKAGDYDFPACS
ncbi:MAG: hypothetical protein M1561_01505 [Gammaproteobacteria bacterium]|nr:hypothetical protein [Gammaproteobacteria bacterium]